MKNIFIYWEKYIFNLDQSFLNFFYSLKDHLIVYFAEAGVTEQRYNEQQISNWIEGKDVYTSQDLIKLQKAYDDENVVLFAARTGNY